MGIAGPIGSSFTYLIGGRLLEHCDWQYLFFIPGTLCLLFSFLLRERLRDAPEDVGLPPLKEETQSDEVASEETSATEPVWDVLMQHIFRNTRLWMAGFANFFIYFMLSGIRCQGPVIMVQLQRCTVSEAGIIMSITEGGAILGAFFVGWFTDKYMPGKRGWCGAMTMWIAGGTAALCTLMSAEFGSPKAAAAAAGFTGIPGYLGSFAGGIGIAALSKNFGWHTVLTGFFVTGLIGGLLFLLTLRKAQQPRTV